MLYFLLNVYNFAILFSYLNNAHFHHEIKGSLTTGAISLSPNILSVSSTVSGMYLVFINTFVEWMNAYFRIPLAFFLGISLRGQGEWKVAGCILKRSGAQAEPRGNLAQSSKHRPVMWVRAGFEPDCWGSNPSSVAYKPHSGDQPS